MVAVVIEIMGCDGGSNADYGDGDDGDDDGNCSSQLLLQFTFTRSILVFPFLKFFCY